MEVEVGKTLTHYRLFQNQKRVPTSLGRIQMVQDYLKNNQAKLVKNERLVKAVKAGFHGAVGRRS